MEDIKINHRSMIRNKTNHDILYRSKITALNLRKNKLDQIINSKRYINHLNENPNYIITISDLDFNDKLITLNLLEDTNLLKTPYITVGLYSNVEKFIKFSLLFIRNYLSLNSPNIKVIYFEFMQSEIKIVDILCELLLNSNKKIKYESSCILINLCYYFSEPVSRIISKEKSYKNIMLFLELDDYILLENCVWILNNMCVDSIQSFNLIMKSKVEQRINFFLKNNISLQFTKIIIVFFKNIQKLNQIWGLKFNFSLIELEEIVFIFIKSVSDELTNECLDYFFYASIHNNQNDLLFGNKFIKKLYQIAIIEKPNEDEYKNKTISITLIGNLLSHNNYKLLNQGLLELFSSLLDFNDQKILRETVTCISRISTCSYNISLLNEMGIIYKILSTLKNIVSVKIVEKLDNSFDYITLRGLVYCLCNCLDESDSKMKSFFIGNEFNIIDSLVFCLQIFKIIPDVIYTILRSFCLLIQFENEIEILNKDFKITNILIKEGILNQLPDFLKSNDENVRRYAEFIEMMIKDNFNITLET